MLHSTDVMSYPLIVHVKFASVLVVGLFGALVISTVGAVRTMRAVAPAVSVAGYQVVETLPALSTVRQRVIVWPSSVMPTFATVPEGALQSEPPLRDVSYW